MENKEYVLSKQLLRSGTSVGANIEEAQQAESRRDFISKLSVALKEAYESRYWMKLIQDANFATAEDLSTLSENLNEVIALLLTSVKTAKKHCS